MQESVHLVRQFRVRLYRKKIYIASADSIMCVNLFYLGRHYVMILTAIVMLIFWSILNLKRTQVGFLTLSRMQRELATIFQRPVDLVSKAGLKPIVRQEVLSNVQVLYASRETVS